MVHNWLRRLRSSLSEFEGMARDNFSDAVTGEMESKLLWVPFVRREIVMALQSVSI